MNAATLYQLGRIIDALGRAYGADWMRMFVELHRRGLLYLYLDEPP
jgi:hypothetical protein